MATADLLKKNFEGIRDETNAYANTATRIGEAFLALLSYIEGSAFLRKDQDDTAEGLITFLKGLHIGNYQPGISGGTLEMDANGSYLEVDRLLVRAKATFRDLEIAKIQYSYGQRIVGKGGIRLTKVEEGTNSDGTIEYKCYFNNKDGEQYYHNPFIVGDQAIGQSWDDLDNRGTHRLWCLVTEVGKDYVVLSYAIGKCEKDSDEPRVGDELCQLGYQGTDHPDRQCAIMESTVGDNAPYYTMLQGINTFSLDGKDILTMGSKNGKGYLQVYGNAYIGDRDKSSYINYDSEKKELEIKARMKATAGSDFTAAGLEKGEGNLIVNSGFTGNYSPVNIQEGASVEDDSEMYSDPWYAWSEHSNCSINEDKESASGKSCTLADGTLKQVIVYPVVRDTYILTLKHKGGDINISLGGATAAVGSSDDYKRENVKIEVSDTSQNTLTLTGSGTVCELMLQAGNISSASWTPSDRDNNSTFGKFSSLQYLLDAIANGSTETLGGLVLTQMLKVGNYKDGSMVQETGGMNGERYNDNSPFIWGGGTLKQAINTIAKYADDPNYSPTDEQLKDMANFVVTHGGRAILTDIIMRGYIYALGGVFKGDIDVEGTLKGGKLKGTDIEGVSGTFYRLSALDSEGNPTCSIYFSKSGRLTLEGDIYNQGYNDAKGRSYRFYTSDIMCRGLFGHKKRYMALVKGSTMLVYPKGIDKASETVTLESFKTADGTTYYKIPLYSPNSEDSTGVPLSLDSDASGMPIDIVVFNTDAAYYYAFTGAGNGKGWDVVNANDGVDVYICDTGGWGKVGGGVCTHFVYVDKQFLTPSTADGAIAPGIFKTGYNDVNWK